MNVLTSTEALPRVSMFVHTWQQHLSACTMSHASTVNIMKEWWIDPPRIWRVFSPRNTRCIDVHICECTTSEIDASELSVSDANSELVCFRVADIVNLTNEWWIDPPRIWRVSSPRDTRYDTIQRTVLSLSLWLYLLSHSALTNADVIYDLLAPRHVYLNHRTSVVFTTSPNEANAAAGHILNPLSVASNGTFTDANLAMRFVYLILLNYRTDLAATLSRYTCAEKRRVIQGHLWPLGRNMASWFLATGETSQQHRPASQFRESNSAHSSTS